MKGKKRTRVSLFSHDAEVAAVHQDSVPSGRAFSW